MNGIVIVDKPAGWTSQDVTARLRRVFGTRRIGHGGTLDPMATGVLPVFVGRATRAVSFFESAQKAYEAVIRLGVDTDTQDITGTVLQTRPVAITAGQLEACLSRFRGEIEQIPPMYSALKVGGQKLCDLARKGQEIPREPRKITVYSLECTAFSGNTAHLRVECSKGTYIRTLCKDIGDALGCLGCMESLRRVRAGAYDIHEAVPLQTLLDTETPDTYLRPVDSMFSAYPSVTLNGKQELRCRNGNSFAAALPDGRYRVYGADGAFLMLAEVNKNIMSTVKSFFDV